MKNVGFAILMFLATLTMAAAAGYLSVTGFAIMFAATYWQALVFASSLEAGKLVAASFLYRYWGAVRWPMKWGMLFAISVAMIFTSTGIYGYLSASYQTSSVSLNVNTQRVTLLEQERERSLTRKAEIDKQITDLPTNYVKARRQLMESFETEVSALNKRITDIDGELLTLKQQTIQDEAHVGPAMFVAKTFGLDPNKAVNYFILLIVLVFDPLAVMMTLATNHVILDRRKTKESTQVQPDLEPAPIQPLPTTAAPIEPEVATPSPVIPITPVTEPLEAVDPLRDERLGAIEGSLSRILTAVEEPIKRREVLDRVRTNSLPSDSKEG